MDLRCLGCEWKDDSRGSLVRSQNPFSDVFNGVKLCSVSPSAFLGLPVFFICTR